MKSIVLAPGISLRIPCEVPRASIPKLCSMNRRRGKQVVFTRACGSSPDFLRSFPKNIEFGFPVRDTSVVQSSYSEQTPEEELDEDDLQFEDVPYDEPEPEEPETELEPEDESSSSTEDIFDLPADRVEAHAIRTNLMRQKLLRKLSDANQHNRMLQRTLRETNDTLLKCKAELATMEMELRFLIDLAQEIEGEDVQPGTRKINGRYIHSHLRSRLEDMFNRLAVQIQDVDAVRWRDVQLDYYGMAEDVRVMGSFDGWTEGEQLSPEHIGGGACMRFSGALKLRPGHYQVKFLVDGVWQLSPELPTIGEGVTANNLLIVS